MMASHLCTWCHVDYLRRTKPDLDDGLPDRDVAANATTS